MVIMLDLEKLEKKGLYIKYDNYLQTIKDSNWKGTKYERCERSSQIKGNSSFYGTKDFEEAYNLAIGGWKEGIGGNFNNDSILEQATYKNIV